MSGASRGLALLLTVALAASGCSRGNGLPDELMDHLAQRGIKIAPLRVHAPLSSRGGYIVARHDAAVAASIVGTFGLERIEADDRQWQFALDRAGGNATAKELWGGAGRPPQFKLGSGGQFEFFYLLVTHDSLMYLIAEYAYG